MQKHIKKDYQSFSNKLHKDYGKTILFLLYKDLKYKIQPLNSIINKFNKYMLL